MESLLAQGKQDIPAIVRRVRDVEGIDYEVVCGRSQGIGLSPGSDPTTIRIFVSSLRYATLTDEEAFRLADIENRNRRDISDYERAVDYKRAIGLFYEGSQKRMCERLKVTETWMSRYLEIAALPEEILSAFGSPTQDWYSGRKSVGPAPQEARDQRETTSEGRGD